MSRKLRTALLSAALFVIGMVRLGPHYDASARFPEYSEAIHLARSLAFHHEYANPFRLAETGPSAYTSPAFPGFLAFILLVFGTGAKASYAFQFAAAAATSAELALLPILSETIGVGLCPGILACIIGLLPPLLTFPDWEASYAALLAVVVTILFLKILKQPESSTSSSVWFGITAGLLLLTSASFFSVFAVWCVYLLGRFRWGILSQARWAALLIPLAMLTPWTVRNYVVFHRLIPFRSAFGFNLKISNNDGAPVRIRESEESGYLFTQSPNYNLEEARRAQALGEPQYDAEKLREARGWIKANPRRFMSLTLQRISVFWVPSETGSPWQEITIKGRRRERLAIYAMTILSVFGLVRLTRTNRTAGIVLLSWLLFFPLIYYVVLYTDRYRYPILWITLVGGAYPLCLACRSLRRFFPGANSA